MEDFNLEIFAKNLFYFRKNRKLTQDELADKIGEKRGIITNYERGKNIPPLPIIVKLASVFEISLDRLIMGKKFYSLPDDSEDDNRVSDQSLKDISLLRRENENLQTRIADLSREINVLRSYTSRLEKDLERHEQKVK